jgi:hypothetical protein
MFTCTTHFLQFHCYWIWMNIKPLTSSITHWIAKQQPNVYRRSPHRSILYKVSTVDLSTFSPSRGTVKNVIYRPVNPLPIKTIPRKLSTSSPSSDTVKCQLLNCQTSTFPSSETQKSVKCQPVKFNCWPIHNTHSTICVANNHGNLKNKIVELLVRILDLSHIA